MQQASRVAEFTGFFLWGKLIEFDNKKTVTTPSASDITGQDDRRELVLDYTSLPPWAVRRRWTTACQA